MSRTIALTGATGFIGTTLTKHLINTGWKIQALVRPTSDRRCLDGITVQWIEGNLDDVESLRRLVHQADAVVHCAGTVRGQTEKQFTQVNVEGVARLVHAAVEQHPLPRFLLISSLAAREPHLSPYATSKRQGEQTLAASSGEMPWTAFRPSAVYGPGDRELLPLFRWIGRGLAPIIGSKDARFSLLYVDDLAEAVRVSLEKCPRTGEVFELHDGRPDGYSYRELIQIVAGIYSRRPLHVKIPAFILNFLAVLNQTSARAIGYQPMLTPGKVRELRHANWVCDNQKLYRETGWQPKISIKEGLRRTLRGGGPAGNQNGVA
ncbi:MAG: NAD-dependent epimerase/dehydratase family protein [Deltaproteobacteria bacterium]|jgi:nucleoside-diphosphate-sugar epimerase|nr:NAD-dependent epimerase/dehydratase family protein [Deltaproteobacteria bacterium]